MSSGSLSSSSIQANNETLFRRIIDEAFTRQEFNVLDEVISPHVIEHQPGMGDGPDGVRGAVTYLHSVFPDFTLTVEDVVVDGDKVWARCRARGTQQGPHMGHPPTGMKIDVTVFDVCRFENGKMVEHWGVPDRFMIMAQLGMLPNGG